MLIAFLSFLPPECEIVWQRPSRWTKLACSHPRRNALLWKRHSSTQRRCVLMATHGYMSSGDPLCHSVALNLNLFPHSVGPLSCLDHSALPLFLYPSFHNAPVFVSERIFAYLPPYSHIFVNEFREVRSSAQMIHIDGQCSALIGCQRLLLLNFSSESHGVSNFIANSTAPKGLMFCIWFRVYSSEWENDGKEHKEILRFDFSTLSHLKKRPDHTRRTLAGQ